MTYDDYLAIIPCILLGLFCGAAQYFNECDPEKGCVRSPQKCITTMIAAAITSFVIFGILGEFEFEFMTKLAISGGVAFLGLDKALSFLERLLDIVKGLRGGKNE